jgi:hypothetical protein
MTHATITITIDTEEPLTGTEQAALLIQFELALGEPQDIEVSEDGQFTEFVNADWRGEWDIQADFGDSK